MKKIAKRYLLTLTLVFSLLFSMNAFAGVDYSDAITIDSADTITLDGQDINVAHGVWVSWSWDEGSCGWINDHEVTYVNTSSDEYCDWTNAQHQYFGDTIQWTCFELYGYDGRQATIDIGAYTDEYGSITSFCWLD